MTYRVLVAALLLASPAAAEEAMPGMAPGTDMGGSAADRAMMDGMRTMSRAMEHVPMTGNADQDFAAMMVPHHQGAIDMAKAELHYGRDPAMRKLARDVVAAQEREIAQMRRWLKAHPSP